LNHWDNEHLLLDEDKWKTRTFFGELELEEIAAFFAEDESETDPNNDDPSIPDEEGNPCYMDMDRPQEPRYKVATLPYGDPEPKSSVDAKPLKARPGPMSFKR
jgi:hypothetical protein